MNEHVVEKESLELPVEERQTRAALAPKPRNPPDAEAEKIWLREFGRRAGEIDEGKVRLVKSTELERRVRTRLK